VDRADFESRVQCEIEFARALTALVLAAKLEVAEQRADQALDRILSGGIPDVAPSTTRIPRGTAIRRY
jgi:hypothetical protein